MGPTFVETRGLNSEISSVTPSNVGFLDEGFICQTATSEDQDDGDQKNNCAAEREEPEIVVFPRQRWKSFSAGHAGA